MRGGATPTANLVTVAGSAAVTLWGALFAYGGLLRPDRNGYSGWWRLMHDRFTSQFLIDAVIPLGFAFAVWLLFAALGITELLHVRADAAL